MRGSTFSGWGITRWRLIAAVFILGLVLFVLISIFQGISDNALTMLMVAIAFPLLGFLYTTDWDSRARRKATRGQATPPSPSARRREPGRRLHEDGDRAA